MDILWVYLTTATEDEAQKISGILLERNLIACANILGGIKALYRWQGKIENGSECAVILKTTDRLWQDVQKAILELHSYETPCIMAFKPEACASAYQQWLQQQL